MSGGGFEDDELYDDQVSTNSFDALIVRNHFTILGAL